MPSRSRSFRARRPTLLVERLETRAVPATFVVLTPDDAGPGSLRQAILDANAAPGADAIAFDIPGAGVHTIAPLTNLPDVTDPVVIDGYTQPGASPNTLGIGPGSPGHENGDGTNAVLRIELDGSNLGNGGTGLRLFSPANTIRGLVLNRFRHYAILVSTDVTSAGGNTIAGNFIGTDPTGTMVLGNAAARTVPAT
jgi:hypothetical protein